MIQRFRILAENTARESPVVGSQVTYRVVPFQQPEEPQQEIVVTIMATDPEWGPDFTRIEGHTQDEKGYTRAVLGYHATGENTLKYIGRIEIYFNDV